MLKDNSGEVEMEVREGKETLLRMYKRLNLDPTNLSKPYAVIEAEVKKTMPTSQAFWTVQARAAIRIFAPMSPEGIKEAYDQAWEIVNAESDRGLEVAQKQIEKLQNRRIRAVPEEPEKKSGPADLPEDTLGWELE